MNVVAKNVFLVLNLFDWRHCGLVCAVAVSLVLGNGQSCWAAPQENADRKSPQTTEEKLSDSERLEVLFKKSSDAGVKFLLEKGQSDDGSFSKQLSPAVTALCTSALLEHRVPVTDVRVQKALTYLESNIRKDGGIYAKESVLRNYETSVTLMCFNRANKDGKYDEVIQNAVTFLKGIQWDEGEGHTIDSSFFGGQGYGGHKRPDASNTSFYQDALKAAGEDPNSTSMQTQRSSWLAVKTFPANTILPVGRRRSPVKIMVDSSTQVLVRANPSRARHPKAGCAVTLR